MHGALGGLGGADGGLEPPPQAQHIVPAMNPEVSKSPHFQSLLMYHEQPLPAVSVELSSSEHGALGGLGGADGGLKPPPQAQHMPLAVKPSSTS